MYDIIFILSDMIFFQNFFFDLCGETDKIKGEIQVTKLRKN